MKIERDERFRGSQRKCLKCLRMKKDDETVNSAKGLRVSNVVGSANDD